MPSIAMGPSDWARIAAYVKRLGGSVRTEPRAAATAMPVDAARVRWFRARASGLAARATQGDPAVVARGGLQDSAPRAALLALHARAEGIGPGSWEHPSLAQVWLRWADHVVPRDDLDIFTVGTMPRDEADAAALRALGEAVAGMLDAGGARPQDVAARLGAPNNLLIRSASTSGHAVIRWDARAVQLLPRPAPKADPERARQELARRFLAWHAPSSARTFARWAWVTTADAEQTFAALGDELADVAVEGRARALLARDLPALLEAEPAEAARLLPMGDPYLFTDKLVAEPEPALELPGIERRLRNSLTGRVLAGGRLVGSWGRRGHHLTIALWPDVPARVRDAVAAEAEAMAGPIGSPMDVRWL